MDNAKATIIAAVIAAVAALISAGMSLHGVKLQVKSDSQQEQFQQQQEQVQQELSEQISELQSEISLVKNRPDRTIIYGGHMYWVSDEPCSWTIAMERCKQKGGHLVTITSEEESKFINAQIKSGTKPMYWLGGSDEKQEGIWTWVTGETWNNNIAQWIVGQPDNTNETEHYLVVYQATGEWNDIGEGGPYTVYVNENDEVIGSQARPDIGYICEWD